MSHPKVQVYILTHNRPQMVMGALNSVLHQNYQNLQVVLSDNSTNDLTEKAAMSINSLKFSYIRRVPALSAEEHFQKVLSEISGDYFLLFHDDDILIDGAIQKYISTMEQFPNASAVGANAFCMLGNTKTDKTFLSKRHGYCNPSRISFLKRYLRFEEIAPFPSYFYRKAKVASMTLDFRKGGKYSDVAFLLDLYQTGEVIWILEPLMHYRIHTLQDSSSYSYSHIRSLTTYIESQNIISKTSLSISYFKARSFYAFWKTGLCRGTAQKHLRLFLKIFAKIIWVRPLYFLPRLAKCLLQYQIPWRWFSTQKISA